VRGAAVLGGIVLVLAGLYFLRYSIEHGLIPPAVRVAIGIVFGVGAILAGERLRPRGYRVTADALAGAGVAILYAAFWAANRLYDAMIPAAAAFGLMALVTAAAGALAWRHRSQLIAGLGLVGGGADGGGVGEGDSRKAEQASGGCFHAHEIQHPGARLPV